MEKVESVIKQKRIVSISKVECEEECRIMAVTRTFLPHQSPTFTGPTSVSTILYSCIK